MVGGSRAVLRPAIALAALALIWGAMLWLGGTGADRAILDALYDAGAPLRYAIAGAITHLGAYPVLVGFTLLGLVALLARGEGRRALLLALLVTSGPLFVELQKNWFGRLRPHDQHLVAVQSYAFPSGHSANSLLIWLSLALLVVEGPRRRWAIAGALVIALAVGLSRPMLGVHWPSDVIGGWALALFWMLFWSRLLGVPLTGAGTQARPAHSSAEGE
ncbi:MAG TPA: phosphatase PAP2 family protein [Allosphingosinicella sp.]|nr:phosphatase PAP2 family protein [Allosphingosinicella sp.]